MVAQPFAAADATFRWGARSVKRLARSVAIIVVAAGNVVTKCYSGPERVPQTTVGRRSLPIVSRVDRRLSPSRSSSIDNRVARAALLAADVEPGDQFPVR